MNIVLYLSILIPVILLISITPTEKKNETRIFIFYIS